jgi:DNA-binding winged helix-turn-helix (wHTH) protein/tetratricopeptide (TPR) repeat protein/TolB-like protein
MSIGTGLAYAFGPFRVEPEKRLLLRDGIPVPLTPKAFETLLILLRNSGKLVRKDALMAALWPETFVEEGNLTQNVFTLRKALGETAHDHRYILTIPGAGYQFTEEVTELGSLLPISNGNGSGNHEARDLLRSEPAIEDVARHRRWQPGYVAGAAVLCTIAIAVITMLLVQRRSLLRSHPQELSTTPHVAVPRRSVAVLGFQDVSADPRQKWVSTALSEMVSTELGAGQELRVVPAEDVSRVRHEVAWKGAGSLSKDTLGKLHRTLESDLVVLGSYAILGQGNNQRLRIDLWVQDTRSGELITTIAETGATADLFDVVSRTGVRLRQQLRVPEMSPTEALAVRASTPSTLAATQLYAQGLEKLQVFDALGARDLLQKALALDPNYPLAHAALADAWSVLGYDTRATSEASKAFQLSTRLATVDRLTIEGRYRIAMRDWPRAVAVYRSLYEMLPDSVDYALRLARAQTSGGHPRDALQTLGSSRQSDTNEDPRIDLETARAWNQLGDFGRMATALSAAADKAKRKGAQLLLARALNQQCWVSRFVGQQQHGIEDCREAQRIYTAAGDHGGEADTLRVLGDVVSVSAPAAAMELYQQSLTMQRRIAHLSGEAFVLNEMAAQYSTQGNHRRARDLFEQTRQIFLRTENRVDAGGLLINIGYELAAQGDLTRAQKSNEAALELALGLGNEEMEALATENIGLIEQSRGNLENAKRSFQRALTLFDGSGDRVGRSDTMFGLGEIARAEGNLVDARNFHDQALALRKEQQRKTAIAESELALADVSLDQGHPASGLEQPVRSALETFNSNKVLDNEVTAEALLTRILFAENKLPEASNEAGRAVALAQTAQPGVRLSMEGEVASVWVATTPKEHLHDLQRILASAITEAHRFGYAEAELRLRLARAESEIRSGEKMQVDSEAAMVRAQAAKRGFGLIGR